MIFYLNTFEMTCKVFEKNHSLIDANFNDLEQAQIKTDFDVIEKHSTSLRVF